MFDQLNEKIVMKCLNEKKPPMVFNSGTQREHYRRINLSSEVDCINQASKTFVQGTIFIG